MNKVVLFLVSFLLSSCVWFVGGAEEEALECEIDHEIEKVEEKHESSVQSSNLRGTNNQKSSMLDRKSRR